jgi:hypothetical protein
MSRAVQPRRDPAAVQPRRDPAGTACWVLEGRGDIEAILSKHRGRSQKFGAKARALKERHGASPNNSRELLLFHGEMLTFSSQS